jgi:hypothetical protein
MITEERGSTGSLDGFMNWCGKEERFTAYPVAR